MLYKSLFTFTCHGSIVVSISVMMSSDLRHAFLWVLCNQIHSPLAQVTAAEVRASRL